MEKSTDTWMEKSNGVWANQTSLKLIQHAGDKQTLLIIEPYEHGDFLMEKSNGIWIEKSNRVVHIYIFFAQKETNFVLTPKNR